jgi:RND family efflux transporter MFP subunit
MKNIMTTYRFISGMIITGIFITLISCGGAKAPETAAGEEEVLPDDIVEMRGDQVQFAGIGLGAIEMRALSGTLKVNGRVDLAPQNLATVCVPMGGFVKSTSLIPGNQVYKGQVLAVIENPDFVDMQESYVEAKNRLEYAEAEFNRHTELYKEDVYSQKNMQQVTSDYKILKAQVKALEQKLALIGIDPSKLHEDDITNSVEVLSPISGYVKTVDVNIGKFVSPTDVLFEIFNSDNLLLELTLYDKDADKVLEGQKIRFYINNETEQHEAEIYQTGKAINDDKTYTVHARVIGECKNVLPGMYVNAVIEVSGDMVASLPSEAVVSFDDKDYIFTYEKDKEESGNPFTEYRMVEIKKGVTDNGYTEIILPDGFDLNTAKVVVKGAYNLLSAKKNAGEMAC